jgi:hypothetical protein
MVFFIIITQACIRYRLAVYSSERKTHCVRRCINVLGIYFFFLQPYIIMTMGEIFFCTGGLGPCATKQTR